MPGPFSIGLVAEYANSPSGWLVTLDTGVEALLRQDNPIPEHFRSGRFGLGLFDKNHGVALTRDASGRALWFPALICAMVLGASIMRHGRIIGLEQTPSRAFGPGPEGRTHFPAAAGGAPLPYGPAAAGDGTADADGGNPFLQEGAITLSLAGGSAAPFHLFPDAAGYGLSAAAIRTALRRMLPATQDAAPLPPETGAGAAVRRPLPEEALVLARIDFAYTFERAILHVRKTTCPDQELAAKHRSV